MAIALLRQAIHDWQRPTVSARLGAELLGFDALEEELLTFFRGEWCRELLQLLDCEGMDLLEELGRRGL